MANSRIEVALQCISAVATAIAALAAGVTAIEVRGQLNAEQITLHVDSQFRLYEAVLSSSQALSDTADALKTAKADSAVAIRQKLKVQALAFDGLIAEIRSENEAGALQNSNYFWIIYQFCPAFKAAGYMYEDTPLKDVEAACKDLENHLRKQ